MRSLPETSANNGGGPVGDCPSGSARAAHSRFVQRIRRRYPTELALLPPGVPGRETIGALIDTLQAGGRALPAALRVARQLVIERLAVLDVEQQAPLDAITLTMSTLAEVTLDRALAQAFADWVVSADGQATIASYQIGGQQLFFPNAGTK